MKIVLLAFSLLSLSLSTQAQPRLDPADKKFTDALTIAKRYAAKYYKVPDCRDDNGDWHYSTWEVGDTLVAEVGPTREKGHGVKVTVRTSNLKVLRVEHIA